MMVLLIMPSQWSGRTTHQWISKIWKGDLLVCLVCTINSIFVISTQQKVCRFYFSRNQWLAFSWHWWSTICSFRSLLCWTLFHAGFPTRHNNSFEYLPLGYHLSLIDKLVERVGLWHWRQYCRTLYRSEHHHNEEHRPDYIQVLLILSYNIPFSGVLLIVHCLYLVFHWFVELPIPTLLSFAATHLNWISIIGS